jgi:asparagine synthase (glutamine-hydrolysing)
MCGIAGIWNFAGGEHEATARAMATRLAHRGPDDSGTWSDEVGLAFGFRRLAIVDLTEAGHQPMRSASGRYVLSFNGEIYNFERLRTRLHAEWRGHSDTEVLLAAIEAWGLENALAECVGMFAFALWDSREQTLSLVRDRAGVKPLYYAIDGDRLQFASELKALDVARVIDENAARLYAHLHYVPAPFSIIRGVRKLPAGSILTVMRDGSSKMTRYWDPLAVAERAAEQRFSGTESEAVDRLESLLEDSVSLRMIADVPLGVFLSGGVDSSLIAVLMQRQSSTPIHTFTIGFEDPRHDEARFGREVATRIGAHHTELYARYDDALELVPRLPQIFDEPFADSSALPTYLVSRLARQSVTVALSGDGGDELFAGYHHHFLGSRLQRRVGKIPKSLRPALGRLLRVASRTRSLGRGLLENDPLARYRHAIRELQLHLPALDDPIEQMAWLDFVSYLPDDILVKVDRTSMAVSLEAREPLLDHRVIEFAWSLPMSMKIREDRGKWILREVLKRHLPASLVDREKQGFGLPLAAWLRGPLREWAEDLLRSASEGPFEPEETRSLWRDHLRGANHEGELWAVLMYEAWVRG